MFDRAVIVESFVNTILDNPNYFGKDAKCKFNVT